MPIEGKSPVNHEISRQQQLESNSSSSANNMKFIIALACLLAVAYAQKTSQVTHINSEVNIDNFQYAFGADNSIDVKQRGQLQNGDTLVVNGEYSYTSPEGEPLHISYTADENGYRVNSANPALPTPPPIPEAIQRSLEYIAAHPPPVEN